MLKPFAVTCMKRQAMRIESDRLCAVCEHCCWVCCCFPGGLGWNEIKIKCFAILL